MECITMQIYDAFFFLKKNKYGDRKGLQENKN